MTIAPIDTQIDQQAVLRELGLNPAEPSAQAVILICNRYGMDPFLKHIVLIAKKPYVTRDGLLHVAHRSGQFDGLETVDTGEDETHWWAKVSVYRKDMGRPFTFVGRYPKSGDNKKFGPEMAVKCAEVAAMRRAFDVTGVPTLEEQWDTSTDMTGVIDVAEVVEEPVLVSDETREQLRMRLEALGQPAKDAWKAAKLPALVRLTEADLDRAEDVIVGLETI